MDTGLFVSSCSRRELARRRSAGRFWTLHHLFGMVRGAYWRLTRPRRMF